MATPVIQSTPDRSSRLSLRSTWLHWIGIVVLAALCIWLALNNVLISIRISLAREQTAIFDDMRERLEKSADPVQQAGFLEYAAGYYPSGTKQVAGSPLDRIVESARQDAVRDMIDTLRARTGEEFGDDPQRWIKGLKKTSRDGFEQLP